MAQPASRNELKEYCLRQLGAPVLEINLADEQCQDLIDDSISTPTQIIFLTLLSIALLITKSISSLYLS